MKFSNEKLEKVLNPPQNPIATKIYKGLSCLMFGGIKLKTNPNIKLLRTFEISVDIGKFPKENKTEIKYLKRLPSPPPIKTARAFTHFSF